LGAAIKRSARVADNRSEMSGELSEIIIVDDTPELLAMLRMVLVHGGYQVRAFERAADALDAAAKSPPDLFMLDITMPEIDGYEACRRIKAMPQLADVPVMFVSALDGTLDKVRGFGAGAVDYVSKPFDPGEVMARVAIHLKLRRL